MAYYSGVVMVMKQTEQKSTGGEQIAHPLGRHISMQLDVATSQRHALDKFYPENYLRKPRKGGITARLFARVDLSGPTPSHCPELGPCWVWTGAKTSLGYGSIWHMGRTELTHVIAFKLSGRDIPEGLEIDHICRNRACVNFDHLEAVTHKENMHRAYIKGVVARPALCACGHSPLAHGSHGCEGVMTSFDGAGDSGPCECRKAVA